MGIELRLLGANAEQVHALPDVESLSLSPVLCDAGTIEFQYPVTGTNAQHIVTRDEFALAVYLDGVRCPELDGLIKDVEGDDIAEDGVWKFTGFFNNGRMDEAKTYPANWPDVDPEKPNQVYTDATAGTILRTLMQQAQARGTLVDLDYSSFSGSHDSNGVPWALNISLEFAPQVSYLDVLKNLYEQGLCEWQVVGRSLRLYVRDSMSVDRTLQDPPVVFRKGRDLTDSPRKRSTRELATAYLTAGANGLYHESVNTTEIAKRRRIEGGSSQGNVSDRGTLIAYSDAQLERVSTTKMEKTHGLEFADEDTPRPIRHFQVGDWAYTDTGVGLERLRIKQWVLRTNADGSLEGSVTMNDFFAEQDEKTARRVNGVIGGSTIAGGSRAEAHMPVEAADGIAPSSPEGLVLTSEAYVDKTSQTLAQVTASWQQVTTNEDGTALEDLGRYLIEYQQPTVQANWIPVDAGTATTRSWSPVVAGVELRARVRAQDKWGNLSPWSDVVFIETGADVIAPPRPTTPSVDNYLGLLRVYWDGGFEFGEARPFDFARVDVHVSDTDNFEPTSETRVGPLVAPGSTFIDVPYGEVRYARLVPYDVTGNAGEASAIAQGTSSQVVSPDIFDGAIGSAKLADLAVTTAKIADLAVNNAKIGSLDVGKLTAGVMNAEVIMGGRIATALDGERVEINSQGIFRWNAAGEQLVAIDNSGALLTGTFRTGLPGTRRVVIGATYPATTGRVDFYSPDGDLGSVVAWTQSSGTEGIQMGMVPLWAKTYPAEWPNFLWNQLNINVHANGERMNLRSGSIELMYDGGATQKSSTGEPFAGRVGIWQTTDRQAGATNQKFEMNDKKVLFWKTGELAMYDARKIGFYGMDEAMFSFDNGHVQWVELGGSSSPIYRMFAPSGYGAGIKTQHDSRGIWVEVRAWDDSGFYGIRAANFEVNSDERDKAEISLAPVSQYVEGIKSTRVKQYRRKRNVEDDTNYGHEIGLIAQEAPAEIVVGDESTGMGIDVYRMSAYLWAAVGELTERLETLEGRKANE